MGDMVFAPMEKYRGRRTRPKLMKDNQPTAKPENVHSVCAAISFHRLASIAMRT
jgi:hypothetical protein